MFPLVHRMLFRLFKILVTFGKFLKIMLYHANFQNVPKNLDRRDVKTLPSIRILVERIGNLCETVDFQD
jgi:hypothetical protein